MRVGVGEQPTRTSVMCEENRWKVTDLSVPRVTPVTDRTIGRNILR
jgi:hypothetical protein